jgi:hypothetical protein
MPSSLRIGEVGDGLRISGGFDTIRYAAIYAHANIIAQH